MHVWFCVTCSYAAGRVDTIFGPCHAQRLCRWGRCSENLFRQSWTLAFSFKVPELRITAVGNGAKRWLSRIKCEHCYQGSGLNNENSLWWFLIVTWRKMNTVHPMVISATEIWVQYLMAQSWRKLRETERSLDEVHFHDPWVSFPQDSETFLSLQVMSKYIYIYTYICLQCF